MDQKLLFVVSIEQGVVGGPPVNGIKKFKGKPESVQLPFGGRSSLV
jgi:hypothetical protein